MINRFVLNEVSYFGPGAREVLPKEIARLGLKKAFVATDKDLIKFGVAEKVLCVLREAGIPYEIFSEIKPNPTVSNVKAGLAAYAASGADFIIAIGGGSSMDTAKAIGIITNNPESGIQRCRFTGRGGRYQKEIRTYHRLAHYGRNGCRGNHQLCDYGRGEP